MRVHTHIRSTASVCYLRYLSQDDLHRHGRLRQRKVSYVKMSLYDDLGPVIFIHIGDKCVGAPKWNNNK